MSLPGIELTWGAEWKRFQRRRALPYVKAAVELACDGLDAMGIQLTAEPEFRTRRVGRGADIIGEIVGKAAELSVCAQDVKRHRVGRALPQLFSASVHEALHLEHQKRVGEPVSLIDRAVSEGLAYCAQTNAGFLLLKPEETYDFVSVALLPIGPDPVSDLMRDSEIVEGELSDDELFDHWFNDYEGNPWKTQLGAIAGIRIVHKALSSGFGYDELLSMEPERVAELGSTYAEQLASN